MSLIVIETRTVITVLITHLKVSPMRVIIYSKRAKSVRKTITHFSRLVTWRRGQKYHFKKLLIVLLILYTDCTVQDLTLIYFFFFFLFNCLFNIISIIIIIYNLLNCHFLAFLWIIRYFENFKVNHNFYQIYGLMMMMVTQ